MKFVFDSKKKLLGLFESFPNLIYEEEYDANSRRAGKSNASSLYVLFKAAYSSGPISIYRDMNTGKKYIVFDSEGVDMFQGLVYKNNPFISMIPGNFVQASTTSVPVPVVLNSKHGFKKKRKKK